MFKCCLIKFYWYLTQFFKYVFFILFTSKYFYNWLGPPWLPLGPPWIKGLATALLVHDTFGSSTCLLQVQRTSVPLGTPRALVRNPYTAYNIRWQLSGYVLCKSTILLAQWLYVYEYISNSNTSFNAIENFHKIVTSILIL